MRRSFQYRELLPFRHREILDTARDTGWVSVEKLAARFDVTPQTIRRDLFELCDKGLLSRVHGGAVPATPDAAVSRDEPQTFASAADGAIARLCAAEIPDGCSLFIGTGTLAAALAEELIGHRNLLVITNNMNAANILIHNKDCELVVAGGAFRRSDGGLVGDATVDLIRRYKTDFAVIGAAAVDEDGVLLDFDSRCAKATQTMIADARQVYLAADSSKFARTAPVRIADLSALDGLFTDMALPAKLQELCESSGVAVHAPDRE